MTYDHAITALTARLKLLAAEYERIVLRNKGFRKFSETHRTLEVILIQMKDIEAARLELSRIQGAEAEKVVEAALAEKRA